MTFKFPASLRVIGRSIVDWWDGWLDMVLVTIVWLFAQFTIILGPPATFGVFYVVHNMLNGEALGLRGLIDGARKSFGISLLWGLLNLVVVVTVIINFQFYGAIEAAWGMYIQIIVVILAVLWLATQFYTLPYYWEMEVESKRLRMAMRNGVLTALAAPLFTLILLVFSLIVIVLSIGLIIPFFLGLPGLLPFLSNRAMYDRLIAFGLRKPDKTPKEIEAEESGKMVTPNLDRVSGDEVHAERPKGAQVSQSEGQVDKTE